MTNSKRKAQYRRAYKARYDVRRALINEIKVERGCAICGYDKHPAALQFHHRVSEEKLFNIGSILTSKSLEVIMTEIEKCDVLCSNCHAEHTWSS